MNESFGSSFVSRGRVRRRVAPGALGASGRRRGAWGAWISQVRSAWGAYRSQVAEYLRRHPEPRLFPSDAPRATTGPLAELAGPILVGIVLGLLGLAWLGWSLDRLPHLSPPHIAPMLDRVGCELRSFAAGVLSGIGTAIEALALTVVLAVVLVVVLAHWAPWLLLVVAYLLFLLWRRRASGDRI